MTIPPITLDVAKQHLRILLENTEFDAEIQRKLDQANAIVLDYIKKPEGKQADGTTLSDLQLTILMAATMMVLSKLYDDRNIGEENDENVALGYLTPQVTAILHRLRDPALA